MAAIIPLPARPVNGGNIRIAKPQVGDWGFETKLNGFRVLEAADGNLFNRHQEKLSIARDFDIAVKKIKALKATEFTDWLDMEGLERRHAIAKGSLVVFDYVPRLKDRMTAMYAVRRARLESLGIEPMPLDPRKWAENSLYLMHAVPNHEGLALYDQLAALNAKVGVEFFEGVVAKRVDSLYPPSARHVTAAWLKFRFKG